MEVTEHNGDIYISYIGVLKIIIGTYLFPDIQEVRAYQVCKRKLEYICILLATRNYCKNKNEAMQEIQRIKTKKHIKNIPKIFYIVAEVFYIVADK